jgi:transposase
MEYGAIDLHTKHSQIRIVKETGEEVLADRVATRPEALREIFGARAPMRVLLETGTESEWVAQLLEQCGHEVVVADPNYAPMYGERTRRVKTDKRDVAALAEANRRGLYRPAHRTSAAQRAVRRQLQTRDALIQIRTRMINVIRTQVRSTGERLPSGSAETVARRVRGLSLSAEVAAAIAPLLTVLDQVAPVITAADEALTATAAADPIVQRLRTAPGVGPVTGLHYRATLDRVERFRDAGAVTAYFGVIPREQSSGERRQRGGITKAGPSRARAALVQASWAIWRAKSGPAKPLSDWAHQLAARRGKKVAVVALARRLARILFAMWRDGRDFETTCTRRTGAAV